MFLFLDFLLSGGGALGKSLNLSKPVFPLQMSTIVLTSKFYGED